MFTVLDALPQFVVTVIVAAYVPAVVGVPVRSPVLERLNPSGKFTALHTALVTGTLSSRADIAIVYSFSVVTPLLVAPTVNV